MTGSTQDPNAVLTVATAELTAVRATANLWFGSLATIAGIGGLVGLNFGAAQITALGPRGDTWAFVVKILLVLALLLYGFGVWKAALAAQGTINTTLQFDDFESMARARHDTAQKAAQFLRDSRNLVGGAVMLTVALAASTLFYPLALEKPTYYRTADATGLYCGTLARNTDTQTLFLKKGTTDADTLPLKAASVLTVVSSCP
ncbi:hypothetical protein [Deinococcus ruber]|uniref:Uncharacterized protein n=1 Tax=Deinococcus ruber TaxID=1848197 RepID=A0A918CNX0_9DEIO|nr:hypothetical protein [Deinococcus ruber]GGR33046.1 hypothetical protein GCM10008957_49290 [Deinococcus ruber]